MNKKLTGLVAICTAVAVSLLSLAATPVFAFDQTIMDGANAARGTDQATSLFGASGVLTTITNVLLFIIGALSVIMIIIGGLRYVISGGNSASVSAAKNTILYAVVGLVIALLAYAVVNFVLGSFATNVGGGGTNV